MKKFSFIIYQIIFIPFLSSADAETIFLNVNESRKIEFTGSQKINVRGRKIIKILESENEITIVGLQPGFATIQSGAQIIEINVIKSSTHEFINELQNHNKKRMGLQIQLKNGSVVVSGKLHRSSDFYEIVDIAERNRGIFVFEAEIDTDIKEEVSSWLQLRLHELKLGKATIPKEPPYLISLPVEMKNKESEIRKQLGAIGFSPRFDPDQLKISPLVRVKIIVAEVNKKIQSETGIDWPEAISARLSPKFNASNPIEIFLKAMEQNGSAQILASPNLLAKSGSEAEFLAGGEFAIKVVSRQMREVLWKKHGIFLKIKPLADSAGRISIELTTEVSMIDASQTVDGIPALKTNRMSTHFDLSSARTIILSGLIRNDWGQSSQGIAHLSNIPILGALFRSEKFHNDKTELVIFVTPEIVTDDDVSPQMAMPESWKQQ